MIKACEHCKQEFSGSQDARFCGHVCRADFYWERRRARIESERAMEEQAAQRVPLAAYPYRYSCLMCGDGSDEMYLTDAQLGQQCSRKCQRCGGRMFLDRADIGHQGAHDTTVPTRLDSRAFRVVPTGRRA